MEWVDLDDLDDLQAIRNLERRFSGWICFRAANNTCCARWLQDPQIIVRGESWADLRDQILSDPKPA
jgi:hypothetical protein